MGHREKSRSSSRRRPMPSMVSYRFEMACEKPVNSDNAKAARLLHYKNLLLKSGASQEEIKCVENSLDSLEDASTEEQPSFSNSAKVDDTDQLEIPSLTRKRTIPNKKLRFPAHLQRTEPLNIVTPPESETSGVKCPESLICSMSSTPSCSKAMFQKKPPVDYLHGLVNLPQGDLDNHYLNPQVNKDIDDLTTQLVKCRITLMDETSLTECICMRKVYKTSCLSCGEIMTGRTFRRCQIHPKIALIFDHFYCQKCYADTSLLLEITEN